MPQIERQRLSRRFHVRGIHLGRSLICASPQVCASKLITHPGRAVARLRVRRFIEAIGLFLIRAKEGEYPCHALLLVDPVDGFNTVLGRYELFGKVALDEIRSSDVVGTVRNFTFGPEATIEPLHSMISLARPTIVLGTVMPSAWAVLRLIIKLDSGRLLNRQA
jgi:hypothetical protein